MVPFLPRYLIARADLVIYVEFLVHVEHNLYFSQTTSFVNNYWYNQKEH